MDLLVFSQIQSPRLNYILNQVLHDWLGLKYSHTTRKDEFLKFKGAKLNYSNISIEGILQIVPHSLIEESEINAVSIKISRFMDMPVFFCTNPNQDMPFDFFAAAFYLISRYEEYFSSEKDKYNRFKAENSLAYQYQFLKIPLIDKWLQFFEGELFKLYPSLTFKKRSYRFLSTIDVDSVWAYKHKGFYRTAGGMMKSLFRLQVKDIRQRIGVLADKIPDPYFNFDYIGETEKNYGFSSIFFFQVGKRGKLDKNISIDNKVFQKFLQEKHKSRAVGIHPSVKSNQKLGVLHAEIENLEQVIHDKIIRSRQHYLILDFPGTYQKLIAAGIQEDYSMGYASQTGFRAGTSLPFKFYDLEHEVTTNLTIHPLSVMDVTLNGYLNYSPIEAIEEYRKLIEEVKKTDGLFLPIWHNESLSEQGIWKGWRQVFEEMVKMALPDK